MRVVAIMLNAWLLDAWEGAWRVVITTVYRESFAQAQSSSFPHRNFLLKERKN